MSQNYDNIGRVLYQLGLDARERELYLHCLAASQSVASLARLTKHKRTGLYPVCEEMARRGFLVAVQHQRGIRYRAARATDLARTMEDEAGRWQARSDLVRQTLAALTAHDGGKSEVVQVEGKEAIRQECLKLLEDATGQEVVFLADITVLDGIIGRRFIPKYLRHRLKHRVATRGLYVTDAGVPDQIERRKEEELREYKILPRREHVPAYFAVAATRVLIIEEGLDPVAIRIDSPVIATTMRAVFNILWNMTPDHPA
jgi:sugar-specific transcriptional regulator TrmB